MVKRLDLTNQRYGRLVALKAIGFDKKRQITWLCKCDCGNYHVVPGTKLKAGGVKSCGCLLADKNRARLLKHGQSNKNNRLYGIWRHMKERCSNPNSKGYGRWGGRGISVCSEWNEYQPFFVWAMESGYRDNLTIDRIDVNGNYEPKNCRWADKLTQANNTRTNHLLTLRGKTKTVAEWSRETGIRSSTILYRVNHGYEEDFILSKKSLKSGKNLL